MVSAAGALSDFNKATRESTAGVRQRKRRHASRWNSLEDHIAQALRRSPADAGIARKTRTLLRAVSVGAMAAGAELGVVFLSVRRRRACPLILRLHKWAPSQRGEQHDRDTGDGLPVIGQVVVISCWLEYYLWRLLKDALSCG